MAYKPTELSVLSYANGFTLWHYRTADTSSDVFSPGYFNDESDKLRRGDMIFINAAVDCPDEEGCAALVRDTAKGIVSIEPMTTYANR